VLRTDELVDAAQKTLAEAVAQYNLVKGQYDAGVVPIVQVYQQDAVVGQDSLGLIQAVNTYKNAETALLVDLNISPNEYENYTFSVAGIDTSTADALQKAMDTSISGDRFNPAIDTRPDIIAQQQSIEASKDQVDETRAALYPKLNASVSIGGSGDNPDLTKIQMANSFNLGLTLSVPIFDAMQNRLLIDEEEINVENQKITLEQDVQNVRSAATTAVINLQSAKEAIIASDAALVSAREGLRLAEEQLNVGSGTEVAVVVAEAALETARTNRVNAKYNWVLAQKQLDYTLGKWNY
jgi:outer membrane protein